MTSNNDTSRLTVKQDRTLVRTRWHSKRFVVAHVTAPEAVTSTERPPVNLAFVIDRSGSMANGRLTLALQAVEEAIGRLKSERPLQRGRVRRRHRDHRAGRVRYA